MSALDDVLKESRAANRLRAAAPRLLEALKTLVETDAEEHYRTVQDTDWTHREADCAFCAAVAAIAEAEGSPE